MVLVICLLTVLLGMLGVFCPDPFYGYISSMHLFCAISWPDSCQHSLSLEIHLIQRGNTCSNLSQHTADQAYSKDSWALWLEQECVDSSLVNQRRKHPHCILVYLFFHSFYTFYLPQSILENFHQINSLKMTSYNKLCIYISSIICLLLIHSLPWNRSSDPCKLNVPNSNYININWNFTWKFLLECTG